MPQRPPLPVNCGNHLESTGEKRWAEFFNPRFFAIGYQIAKAANIKTTVWGEPVNFFDRPSGDPHQRGCESPFFQQTDCPFLGFPACVRGDAVHPAVRCGVGSDSARIFRRFRGRVAATIRKGFEASTVNAQQRVCVPASGNRKARQENTTLDKHNNRSMLLKAYCR